MFQLKIFRGSALAALVALSLLSLAAVAIACSGGSEKSNDARFTGLEDSSEQQFLSGSRDFSAESAGGGNTGPTGFPGASGATSPPAPAATAVPRPPSLPGGDLTVDGLFDADLQASQQESGPAAPLDDQIFQVSNDRIIVRNVDLSIEVTDTAAAIAEIGALATTRGGWVVRTQNVEVHRGQIDIRVPVEQLDSVLAALRGIASEVKSEISTSQDFTEEFTDTTARIRTLQDTVDALRLLFSRAEAIEDALAIQQEITRVQSDIEAMQARINFLSQSAAFSLVRVGVLALPQEMVIDAGGDKLAAVGRPVRFRAEFTPPEGIEDFLIEWDFGDGSHPQVITAVAPVNVDGRVISAPAVHAYGDDTDSPYIVTVKVTGTGESGAAEGEAVLVVTVNRVPAIEVFAGEDVIVDRGREVTLRGTFTRPEGVTDLAYTWDFGDGSAPVTVEADSQATLAEIKHTYANSRPSPYDVILTVKGETEAGSTDGKDSLRVLVAAPEGLGSDNFTPGDSGRSAVRALASVGGGIVTALVWAGIFSPVWLLALAALYFYYRNRVKSRRGSTTG